MDYSGSWAITSCAVPKGQWSALAQRRREVSRRAPLDSVPPLRDDERVLPGEETIYRLLEPSKTLRSLSGSHSLRSGARRKTPALLIGSKVYSPGASSVSGDVPRGDVDGELALSGFYCEAVIVNWRELQRLAGG